MKRKSLILIILLFLSIGIVNTSNNTSYAKGEEEVEPLVKVKRKWVTVFRVYPAGNEPDYIFYDEGGFKGYIGKKASMPYWGSSVVYEGYVYSGDAYPIITNKKVKALKKKRVRVYAHYNDIVEIKDYWYNVGGFKGWLYERDADAYQRKDGTWDVYYNGEVIYCPKCSNTKLNKR